MMRNNYLSWFLLAPLVLIGCSWTNTVWLVPQDQTTSTKIELVKPEAQPAESPFALVEAKAIKTWDSPGDLLGSNIAKAKEIGATHIWCPGEEVKGLFKGLTAIPPIPSKEEIGLLKEFLIAVTDLIKAVIALPVTFRSEAISNKTLLCSVYRTEEGKKIKLAAEVMGKGSDR